jgi:hypothetical protein
VWQTVKNAGEQKPGFADSPSPSGANWSEIGPTTRPKNDESPGSPGLPGDGRYWARTSDLRLVEAALSQLS